MRLVECSDDDLKFTEDLGLRELPPYAILSHTWGFKAEEVTFH